VGCSSNPRETAGGPGGERVGADVDNMGLNTVENDKTSKRGPKKGKKRAEKQTDRKGEGERFQYLGGPDRKKKRADPNH